MPAYRDFPEPVICCCNAITCRRLVQGGEQKPSHTQGAKKEMKETYNILPASRPNCMHNYSILAWTVFELENKEENSELLATCATSSLVAEVNHTGVCATISRRLWNSFPYDLYWPTAILLHTRNVCLTDWHYETPATSESFISYLLIYCICSSWPSETNSPCTNALHTNYHSQTILSYKMHV